MVLVFTETTSTLSAEYVSSFSSEKLAVALFRIGKDAGVECSEAKKSFTLAGDWINMIKAHNILEEYFQKEVEDKIQLQKSPSNVNGSLSKENRRGRKPGCTVDKSLYKQIPQPVLHYHDDEGQTLTHRKYLKSNQDETVASKDNDSKNDDQNDKMKNKADKDNHVSTSMDKSIEVTNDAPKEEGTNDVTKEKEKHSVIGDKSRIPDVKVEFDYSLMDDDTDVDEQYVNSPDRASPSCALDADSNIEIKIEVEDEAYYGKQTQASKIAAGSDNVDKKKKASAAKSKGAGKKKTGEKKKRIPKKRVTSKVGKQEQDQDFTCDQCEYIGKKKENLREHTQRMHRNKFSCETCKKQFGLHKDLLRHTRHVHATPSFHCKVCDKSYKFSRAFKDHMRSHEANYVKPHFECDICHKTFSTKYVLTSHVKSEHLGIKKSFICPTCGRSFTQKNSYLMHANVHAGIKPYVCDVCGKAFSYDKSLKEHKYMHDEERRFGCDLCSKRFRQKTSLLMHMKVHKEARDYICTACGKGFTQKQALLRHERIHSGDKPFKCALCMRSFNDYSIIRRHMMMHHKRDKDPKTWRGDIICTLKRRTEFYIEGGPGYNGGDKLPMAVETKSDEPVQATKSKSISESVENSDANFDIDNFSAPCAENTGSAIDSTGLYHLQDSSEGADSAPKLSKSDHSVSPAMPLNYSLPANFQPSVTLPSGQSASEDAQRQYQDMLDYRGPAQRHEVFLQNLASVPPLPGLSSQGHIGSVSGDTTQGQTIPNPWGLSGYPPYYTPANFSHYPSHQN